MTLPLQREDVRECVVGVASSGARPRCVQGRRSSHIHGFGRRANVDAERAGPSAFGGPTLGGGSEPPSAREIGLWRHTGLWHHRRREIAFKQHMCHSLTAPETMRL
jgi:hypothetical protein